MQATKIRSYFNGLTFQVLAGLLSAFSLIPANAQELELTKAEQTWIEEHPVIRVHNEMDWPPFNFSENGKPSGFSIDFMNLLTAKAGLQVEYVSGPSWDQFVKMIRIGELDVMLNIVPTPDRTEYLNFTEQYLLANAAVVVRDSNHQVKSIQDLYGKSLAMPEGFSTQEFFTREHPEIELVLEPDTLGALFAVIEGRADAMLDMFPVTKYLINHNSLVGLQVAFMSRDSEISVHMAIGIRKDWPILQDILQKAIDSLDENIKVKLRERWLGDVRAEDNDDIVQTLSAEEIDWIKEHPIIRVQNELNWPPFNFKENGEPRGFSIDFMNLVASRVGLQLEYISGPSWNEFLNMLQAGELDVLANTTPTDARREHMHFTSIYFDQPVAIVVNDATIGINSFEDLRGKRVAVVEGFFQQEYMQREYPEAELVLGKDILDSIYAVLEGRADALVSSYASTKYLMDQYSLIGLRFAVISRDPELLSTNALAVRKDWPVLRDILQKGMNALEEEEIALLRRKWVGTKTSRTSAAGGPGLSAKERTWISEHPVIRVHNEMNWPPFNFNENGEPRGFSIDFMGLVAAMAGLQIEYISGPSWNEFLDMLQTGELDVIANAAPTDERQKYMHFTSTFFDQPVAVVINDSTTGINSLEDLRGRRVAVVEGFFHHEYMERKYPEAELVLAKDVLDGLYAVIEGRADALVSSFPSAKYLMDQHALFGLRVAVISRDPELLSSIALAVRKDWPVLRDILQKGMDALDDNELTALRQKWIGTESSQTLTDEKLRLTAEERAWISDHPVIRVHNEMDWPPFNFNENGEPRGFSIDFMNLVASRAGLQVEYISGPSWNEFMEMIRTGELDVIANATPSDERREYMRFTSTFIDQPVAVVINDSTTGINSLEDLRGRRVAVVEGFFHHEYMERQYPEAELVLAEDVLDALYAVMEGRADALLSSFPSTKYLMDKHALFGLRVAVISRNPELMSSNAIAVRKDWPVLRDILQKSMDSLDQEEVTALRQKWLGPTREVEVQDSLTRTISWLVGITLSIFLLLIVLYQLSSHFSGAKGLDLQTGTRQFRILILVALSIFVALVGIIGWLAQDYIKGKILQDVDNNLENVLITTAQRLEFWVDQQANGLNQVAKNPTLLRQIELLLDVPADSETLLSSAALSEVRTGLEQYQEELGQGYFIINPDGFSIGSSRDSSVGKLNIIAMQRPELLARIFQGEAVLVPPIISKLALGNESQAAPSSLYIGVPIRGGSGEVIAALTKQLDPNQGFSRVLQYSRVGQSGESYAFDGTGTLLSASRFEDDLRKIGLLMSAETSIMNIQIRDPGGDMTEGFRSDIPRADQPLTHMASNAIASIGVSASTIGASRYRPVTVQKGEGDYRDYRGVPVYGAWLWDSQLGLGLTSEIDVTEALSTFTTIRILALVVMGITLILSLGGTLFVLATGERTNQYLRKARDELEEHVEERTLDLNAALDELESVSSVILRWLPDVTISSMNTYGLNLFGYSAEELIGKSQFGTIIKIDNEHAHAEIEDMIKDIVADPEQYFHLECQNFTRDGEELWMTWSNNPILNQDGSLREILAIGQDITERKILEAELETAMNQANAATKAKGDFLANMSHEIRTPMNAIIGLSDLCLRSGLNPKQHDYLSKIHASANALLVIINDILDFSKIEAGKVEIERIPFLLNEVLDHLAMVSVDSSQSKRLELLFRRDPHLPDVLMGDPTRVGQVLSNLVSNAIKFTEAGEVVVDLQQMNRSANTVTIRFSVSDTGVGMSEVEQAQLFKSFSQADSTITRKYGGTGLGLAISQQLTRLMGGNIEVNSTPGQGSTFKFDLEMDIVEEHAAVVESDQELKGLSVLVVDDNAMAREILNEYLDSFGHQVTLTESGEQALELFERSQSFDLVLVDWVMPGISGLDVAAYIQQHKIQAKIILVSSRDMDSVEHSDLIDEYLAKPVNPSALFDTIMRTFGKRVAHYSNFRRRLGELNLAPLKDARVLVVEDSEINQQIATELLQEASMIVEIAPNGQVALDKLEHGSFDCVLMDVQMPVMDGYTATRKIREDARFKDLPVLAMTANAMPEDRAAALESGMNDHIPKPIDPQQLYRALLRWITGEKQPKTLYSSAGSGRKEVGSRIPDVAKDAPGLPAELPGIRINEGLARLNGNATLYLKLLQDFISEYTDCVNNFQQQLDGGDLQQASMLAHKLRGVANNLSAWQLGESAQVIEEHIKAKRAVTKEDVGALQAAFTTMADSVSQISDNLIPNASAGTINRPEILKLFQNLQQLIANSDARALDLIEQLLAEVETDSELTKDLDAAKDLLEGYNFADAALKLKSVEATIDELHFS